MRQDQYPSADGKPFTDANSQFTFQGQFEQIIV